MKEKNYIEERGGGELNKKKSELYLSLPWQISKITQLFYFEF